MIKDLKILLIKLRHACYAGWVLVFFFALLGYTAFPICLNISIAIFIFEVFLTGFMLGTNRTVSEVLKEIERIQT